MIICPKYDDIFIVNDFGNDKDNSNNNGNTIVVVGVNLLGFELTIQHDFFFSNFTKVSFSLKTITKNALQNRGSNQTLDTLGNEKNTNVKMNKKSNL